MAHSPVIGDLHASLNQRWRPEDVTALALPRLRDLLSPQAYQRFQELAVPAGAAAGHSLMPADFERPQPIPRLLNTTFELFTRYGLQAEPPPLDRAADADAIERWARHLSGLPAQTSAAGPRPALSRRRTARLQRCLQRIARQNTRIRRMQTVRDLAMAGRTSFAPRLGLADFAADELTAITIAYVAARRNLRAVFTNAGQQGTTDQAAELLLGELAARPGTHWWALAHVRPAPSVLRRLTDAQRGRLLGWSTAGMRQAATLLRRVADASVSAHIELAERHGIEHYAPLGRTRVIVRRGDDSTTWNIAARAFNTMRDNYLACVQASDLHPLAEVFCPPKAMRLMAADVARWHSLDGGAEHPDVRVAGLLPAPWEAMSVSPCGAADIARACEQAGVDPAESGWARLRGPRETAPTLPTAELVHGIAVADPALALLLRRAGAFAGPSHGRTGTNAFGAELAALLAAGNGD
ncbi:hypothetical protein [Bailinhaonella thermotolerans]|uniref:Uncharacterized protein n=1 Tax=Bailinhaonella thermotolerans TaxID=1070861 RepID=A0A3A4A5V9_9ACTN|nr:hypothetical protein [Bailinhaonella thermotolerans]RJL23239.1 hypothetical protein D5H75_33250 [Bailinhaonella thermotolerans]